MTEREYRNLTIPNTPGIYFFKKGNDILYIGKATNLATRTKSYFSPSLMQARGPLIVKMIEEADALSYAQTDSVLEALLLESHMIKLHQPAYNSKEKDNKSHNYVIITDEEFPRIFPVRKRSLDRMYYKKIPLREVFGPFPQGNVLKEALGIIRKIFPFYGKNGKGSYSEHFYQQLALLPHSMANELQSHYLDNINFITDFFKGKKKDVIAQLQKKMNSYARELKFEQAQLIKQQIAALTHIRDMALMRRDFELGTISHAYRIEGYDVAHLFGESMVGVMVVHQAGQLDSHEYRSFSIRDVPSSNDTAALEQVLERRFHHNEWQFPDLIVIDGGIAQKNRAMKFLREQKLNIPVVSVVKDEKHRAKGVLGVQKIIKKYQHEILLVNAEAHRFSLNLHRKKRQQQFKKDM